MRVLIADDDAAICVLIRKVIQSLGEVEILEARSGDEALVMAMRHEPDLLVVDWDMPGKTGLDVVQAIRGTGSDVPIVMVTGISERAKVLEAVAAGISDFIVKPFGPAMLREKVQRYWTVEESPVLQADSRQASGGEAMAALASLGPAVSVFGDNARDDEEKSGPVKLSLHSVLHRVEYLSTLPEIAIRAMAVANDPNSSAAELREVLEGDPGITAKVLRCANSAAAGTRKEINDLQQAISLLGLTQIRHLILTASVSDLFKTKGGINSYRRLNLWRHMISVAICARMIARKLNFANDEEIFLAGLMHDIGIVLEDQYTHHHFCKIIRGLEPEKTLIETEREHLAFDHTTLGETLATRWGFPDIVRSSIRYHHGSMLYDKHDKLPVRCVELANMICSFRGITSVGINLVRHFDPEAAALKLTQSDVTELAQGLDQELARNQALLHI